MATPRTLLKMVATAGACTIVAGAASARPCVYTDHYALPAESRGEAEILEMYSALADAPDVVVCDFITGDRVAMVATINDWPGGDLTQDGTLFYCGTDIERCILEDLDYGYLEPGDYLLVIEGEAPGYFNKPVCNLDWDTEIFVDGVSWDIGGRGELAPGPDLGPEPLCECMHFRHFPTATGN